MQIRRGERLAVFDHPREPDGHTIASGQLLAERLKGLEDLRGRCRIGSWCTKPLAQGVTLGVERHYLQAGAADINGKRHGVGESGIEPGTELRIELGIEPEIVPRAGSGLPNRLGYSL